MDVILLERVDKLGNMGATVKVRPGYARNYLLPKGKALRATKDNLAYFESRRADLEAANAARRADAEGRATSVEGLSVVLVRQASDSGQLYGSVRPRDIAEALAAQGTDIGRAQIKLDTPIKTIGLHKVRVGLHPEVTVEITVNVARSQEEAELQAQGKSAIDAEREAEREAEELARAGLAAAVAEAEAGELPAAEPEDTAER